MKTQFTALCIALTITIAYANDSRYEETMSKNIQLVYHAQTTEELQQAVNQFDRIGSAEKTKWEPFYYAAFGYVLMANKEKDAAKKDVLLDQAKAAIDKASAIKQDESEIVTMQGFVSLIRVTVDPAARGQQYTMLAGQSFKRALELNPENPRALAMQAQMQFGTARFFSGPTDEACATTRKALEKFATFQPASLLAPAWGKESTAELLKQCK
jgi:hypothetical protein